MTVTHAERELLNGITAFTFPSDSFSHATHMQLAWTLLAERPMLDAMCAFRRVLLAYLEHHKAADKYNETITCFYLLLIRDRMDRLTPNHSWHEFQLANPALFGSARELLEDWYPAGEAFLSEAKDAFRLPPDGSDTGERKPSYRHE
jgi:hypothetical protein